jgi:hypothetical protein
MARYRNPSATNAAVLGLSPQVWQRAKTAVVVYCELHPEKEWVEDAELATLDPLLADARVRTAMLQEMGLARND